MLEPVSYNIKLNSNLPVFKGGTSTPPFADNKPDEFIKRDKNDEKKKLSSAAKWGIAGGAAAIATIAFLVAKGRVSEAKKLAEHIEFKKAENIEDAIKFGKEHLGIKHYRGFKADDLDAVNWINEGLVNTSNKFKGVLRMPKNICYMDLDEKVIAGVVNTKGNPYYGWFFVNKKFFSNPVKEVNDYFKDSVKKNLFIKADGKYKVNELFSKESRNELIDIVHEFQETKSFNSCIRLYNAMCQAFKAFNAYKTNPLTTIKTLLKDSEIKSNLDSANILTDIEQIKKLPKDKLKELRKDMLAVLLAHNRLNYINDLIRNDKVFAEKLVEKGILRNSEPIKALKSKEVSELYKKIVKERGEKPELLPICLDCDMKKVSPFETIYHEMGHLQDMKPRVSACSKFNYDSSKYPKELKEWVDNDDYITAANRISSYAADGPGEFIAETFARMINGNKIPDEVLALYNKLEGPKVPGYC